MVVSESLEANFQREPSKVLGGRMEKTRSQIEIYILIIPRGRPVSPKARGDLK